jgi:hypothetical protein
MIRRIENECLRRLSRDVRDETGIGIVFHVIAFDEMLEMIEWRVGLFEELQHGHLHDVDLHTASARAHE